jgi:nitrogen fixation negative regulator NifL
MEAKMEAAEREDKLLTDMLDIIRFTEEVSAKLHRVADEAKIYQVVKDEFAQSDRYLAVILLLADEGESLRLAAISMPPSRLEVLEKASGLQAKEYRIKLSTSGIFNQVVKEGKTAHANISDTISEFLPRPIAYMISKTMGYEKQSCIMTPLYKHGRVIGVLGMSCTDLCQYFTHSVENLALHISTALEFAHQSTQRNRAVQALKRYHDHLGELVEERTAELKTVNEKLLEEIAERKQAEEALRESEERYRWLADNVKDVIWLMDLELNFLWFSPSCERLRGYTIEEMKAMPLDKHVTPESFQRAWDMYVKCMDDEKQGNLDPNRFYGGEFEFFRKDGSTFWADCKMSFMRDENGKATAMLFEGSDITERKRAEEALRKIEQEKSAILNSTLELMVYQDAEHRILWANKAAAESVALSIEQLAGRRCYEVWHRRDKPCVGCPVAKACETDKPQRAEMTTPDGRVWLVRGYPVRDANDNVVGAVEVALDITERKRMEEVLRESEEKYRMLVEDAPVGIFNTDLKGKVTYVNRKAREVSGYSWEELVGKNGFKLGVFSKEALILLAKRLRERLMGKPPLTLDIQFKCKDGHWIWVSLEARFLQEQGKPVGLQVIIREITERKKAVEALKESEERFRSIVENSQAGIMILDDAYLFTYVNGELCRMSGYSPKEVIGQDFRQFLDEESRQLVADRYVRRQKGEKVPPRYEFNFVRKDGQKRRVEISSAVIKDSAGKVKTVAQLLDITERKRAEEALRESEEKYKELAGSITDLFFAFDKDLRYTYWNKASEELTGIPAKDALGKHLYDIFPDSEMTKSAERAYLKALKTQKVQSLVNEFRIGDKDYFFEISAYPSKDGLSVFAKDITERKAKENDYHNILQTTTDGFWILDSKGHFLDVNDAYCALTGYSREELLKMSIPDIEAMEKPEETNRRILKIIKTGHARFETRHRCKDGRIVSVEISTTYEGIGDGRFFVFARDVTERKRAEQALADEATRRRILIDQSLDGIVVLDVEARVVEANQCFAEMLGYTLEEVRKLHTWDWDKNFPPEKLLEMGRAVDEKGLHLETKHHRKDGSVIDVDISINGTVVAGQKLIFCVCRDVTARKRMGEALQSEKNKLQSLIDSMEDGLTIQDKDYNIIFQNGPTRIASGGDHVGEKCYRAYVGQEKVCNGCPVEKAFKDGKSHTVERRRVVPSGEVTFWENTASPIRDARGEIVACLEVTRSITERKQAEQALADEATRRRILVDQSRDGIVVLDENGKVYETNKRFAEMLGYSPEEVTRLHVWDWEAVAPRERVLEMLQTVDEAGDHFETCHRRKDGTLYDVEISTNGAVVAGQKLVFCVCRDITERKQSEERLRLLSSVTQQVSDATLVTDLNFNITYVNKAAQDLFGYSAEEMRGKHMDFFNVKIPYKSLKQEVVRRITSAGLWVGTLEKTRKDGSTFLSECHISPLYDNEGKISSYVDVLRDVTELRRGEEALRESQKFSSSLLESSPIPINVVNLDTSVRYANPAFEKLTGFTLAEIAGSKAPHPWWPEGKKKLIVAALRDAVEHGGRRSGNEHNFRKKNGERFWVTIESAPVIHEGKPVYLIISLLDITERKQAEEKEKQLQRELYLAQRLASVGELAAGVAHEINNPLTGVLGFSQRLMRKSKDEGFKRDLEIINTEARRAADVVQNLLTFARRRQPKKEQANINDIAQRTLELRTYAMQTSNIEVTTALAPSLPKIMVDFPQIQEVFLNIILNAEQAMSEANGRGRLVIKTRRLKDYVRVSFADDGPGIPPKNLDKIFDPFFTTRADRGGTGLGLSACHGIVTEHGGRIYARSKPGEGATFIVELPLSPSETTLTHRV